MSSRTRTQLEKWIATKTLSGKILDVGGAQLSIKGRANLSEGSEIKILDLPSPHVNEKGNTVDLIGDLNLPWNWEGYEEYFDSCACLEVSEYWYNPLLALVNIQKLLKRGASFYISFHFIYPVHNPVDQDYLRYTRRGAIKLLENAGFEIKEIVPRTADDMSFRNFCVSESMRPAKGYEHHEEVGVLIEAIKK